MDAGKAHKCSRHWDAGDIGCGRLITELKRELGLVEPGGLLRVTAHNGGAPVDIPAWCRMTGHTLVSSNHPHYVLRKKGSH